MLANPVPKKLQSFLLDNGTIPEQHDFISSRPVLINLVEGIVLWTRTLDQRNSIDSFFDFVKAFHRVPRRRVLNKFDHCGIRGPLLSWTESFLSNRCFYIEITDTFLAKRPLSSVASRKQLYWDLHNF